MYPMVATKAINDAGCAVEFYSNVTVYMGDPNCNSTVYEDVDVRDTNYHFGPGV